LNGLLEFAVEAHGGLSRWRELTSITARLSLGGSVLATTGWESVLEDVAITIDTRVERASLAPFTGSDRRGIFMADRVAVETDRGELLHERFDPRLGFKDHSVEVAWDALQAAYFIGCSLWTALTVPFLLTKPGFQIEELERESPGNGDGCSPGSGQVLVRRTGPARQRRLGQADACSAK